MPSPSSRSGSSAVRIDRDGPVTLITLQRPEARNAVDPPTALALYEAMLAFDRDSAASVAVLSGAGGVFCAGFDLKALASGAADAWLGQLHFGAEGNPPLGPMGPTRLMLSKPVIAAIAGPAVAGGMELALWCDLRVMEHSAWMGVLCRRWNVPLIDGGTVRLPRLIGLGRALELIMTGRRIDAAECQAIGLCERLVASGCALEAAVALAHELSALPQECLRSDRASARQASRADEMPLLQAEFAAGSALLRGHARAGAVRFADGAGRHGATLE